MNTIRQPATLHDAPASLAAAGAGEGARCGSRPLSPRNLFPATGLPRTVVAPGPASRSRAPGHPYSCPLRWLLGEGTAHGRTPDRREPFARHGGNQASTSRRLPGSRKVRGQRHRATGPDVTAGRDRHPYRRLGEAMNVSPSRQRSAPLDRWQFVASPGSRRGTHEAKASGCLLVASSEVCWGPRPWDHARNRGSSRSNPCRAKAEYEASPLQHSPSGLATRRLIPRVGGAGAPQPRHIVRRWPSGQAPAFQAGYAGSIPALRSIGHFPPCSTPRRQAPACRREISVR